MLSSFSNMASTGMEEKSRDTAGASCPTTSSSALPTSIHELLWEEKKRSLKELIANYRLPLAVKLKSGDISKFTNPVLNKTANTANLISGASSTGPTALDSSPGKVDLSNGLDSNPAPTDNGVGKGGQEEPVLQIHEIRRRKIILARKMTWEKRQNDYVVTGEQVEIPASFKGWLEVVPDDGRPVEYFDTVGGITSVKPRRFLVRTSTVGYQLSTEENGNSCWMPTEIKPGEVLTTGIIYMDNKKNKNATQRNIFKRFLKQNKTRKEQDLKYLQCFYPDNREIMIPLIMSGVFSPVGDATMANYDAVYELQDLIMAFGLPVNAQLIHVNSLENFQCPRGVLRLYGTREEELAIVSRVGSDGALFTGASSNDRFEIPLAKDLLFSRGVVKKKPTIKAKLVDVVHSPWDKEKVRTKEEERDKKDRDYVRAKSIEEFKLRGVLDRRLSAPVTNRAMAVTANSSATSHVVPSYGVAESRDSDHHRGSLSVGTYGGNSSIQHSPNSPLAASTISGISSSSSAPHDSVRRKLDERKHVQDENGTNKDIELPERVKELKKSKSTGLLDKLSVRKVRKERAKLKELKGDDVFSKRIARNDLSYQDFYDGLDGEEENKLEDEDRVKLKQQPEESAHVTTNVSPTYSGQIAEVKRKTGIDTPKDEKYASLALRRQSVQNRDLPPIPPESPTRSIEPSSPYHRRPSSPDENLRTKTPSEFSHHNVHADSYHHNSSKESVYEHLPPAPQLPGARRASLSYDDSQDEKDEEDGYMVPKQIQMQMEQRYAKNTDVSLRRKTQSSAGHDSTRYARSRKTRSEIRPEFWQQVPGHYDDGCPLDIDDLFSFAYNSKDAGYGRPTGTLSHQPALSTSQLYGSVAARGDTYPAWRSDLPRGMTNFDHRFVDNLNLETRGHGQDSRHRQKQARSMSANPNATIRSHNLRKMRPNVMEVFHFTDSFRDIRDPDQNHDPGRAPPFHDTGDPATSEHGLFSPNARPSFLTSRSIDASMALSSQQQANIYGTGFGMHYTESEPGFRGQFRSLGVGGLGDTYVKQGDDSAISMCSRGEGAYPNDSEYSYNEYIDQPNRVDDGWTPPSEIEAMSVQEVSKSLRYIGMKDRVVLRFSNEQIDGSMLCTLDKKLLKEGFPELNALELKKILDFVQGWRPKKR